MADPDGRPPDAVNRLADLAGRAAELDFFQVLRRLEATARDKPRLGTAARPVDEPVRIGQEPSAAFAPSALSQLSIGEAGKPATLTVLFQGLFGPGGPLPLHITDYARYRLRNHGDPTLVRFADVFHHRLLLLFYRAWAQAEPSVSFDRPREDRFTTYVASTFGAADPTARGRDALPDSLRLFYAGLLSDQTKPRESLRAFVADALGINTSVEEYVGEWVPVPERARWKLGKTSQSGLLGQSTTLGGRAWLCQHKFRIVLGPLDDRDRETLRPGSERFRQLSDLVRAYVGDELRWDVKLLVREADVVRLGRTGHLGWSAFLGPADRIRTAGEVIVDPDQHRSAAGRA